jgi:hypothetical protein
MILSRFRVFILPLFFGILLVFSFFAASDANTIVNQVSHLPENPEPEDLLIVKIELQNVHNISSVEIFFCSMDPFVCFYTDDLNYTGNGTFIMEMNLGDYNFEEGTVIGYNFKISYEDGLSEKYPNKESLQKYEDINEFAKEEYYFTITLQDDAENESGDTNTILHLGLGALLALMIIFGIVTFHFLRKRKENIE